LRQGNKFARRTVQYLLVFVKRNYSRFSLILAVETGIIEVGEAGRWSKALVSQNPGIRGRGSGKKRPGSELLRSDTVRQA
jgi:hypothetical protein